MKRNQIPTRIWWRWRLIMQFWYGSTLMRTYRDARGQIYDVFVADARQAGHVDWPGSSLANETLIPKPSEYLFDRHLHLYGEFAADKSRSVSFSFPRRLLTCRCSPWRISWFGVGHGNWSTGWRKLVTVTAQAEWARRRVKFLMRRRSPLDCSLFLTSALLKPFFWEAKQRSSWSGHFKIMLHKLHL